MPSFRDYDDAFPETERKDFDPAEHTPQDRQAYSAAWATFGAIDSHCKKCLEDAKREEPWFTEICRDAKLYALGDDDDGDGAWRKRRQQIDAFVKQFGRLSYAADDYDETTGDGPDEFDAVNKEFARVMKMLAQTAARKKMWQEFYRRIDEQPHPYYEIYRLARKSWFSAREEVLDCAKRLEQGRKRPRSESASVNEWEPL